MDLQEPMDLKDIQQLPEEEKPYYALAQIFAVCDKQRCHGFWYDKTRNEYLWKTELGRPEFILGRAVNTAMGGCGEVVANT